MKFIQSLLLCSLSFSLSSFTSTPKVSSLVVAAPISAERNSNHFKGPKYLPKLQINSLIGGPNGMKTDISCEHVGYSKVTFQGKPQIERIEWDGSSFSVNISDDPERIHELNAFYQIYAAQQLQAALPNLTPDLISLVAEYNEPNHRQQQRALTDIAKKAVYNFDNSSENKS